MIFEIKTSTSPQAVYTALGQLLFHGEAQRVTGKRMVRCLVLPQAPDPRTVKRIEAVFDVRFLTFARQLNGAYTFEGIENL